MGTPTQQNWSEGLKLAQAMNFRFPQFAPTPLSKIIPHACPEAIDLLNCMLHWDPNKRLTAVQCLQVCVHNIASGDHMYQEDEGHLKDGYDANE